MSSINKITDLVVLQMQLFIQQFGLTPNIAILPKDIYMELRHNLGLEHYQFTEDKKETIAGLIIVVSNNISTVKVGVVV